jgi:4-alpha-glucanotransferase
MDDIAARAAELGIECDYFDARGVQRTVPQETLRRLIAALAPSGRTDDTDAPSIIVAPDKAYQFADAAETVWVLAVQLYGVRSHRNWGHGDFTDLLNLVRLVGDCGGAGIGLNPLHALFEDRAEQASPYAPNSRLFLNVLYIDAEAIPEFPGLATSGLAGEIARLRTTTEVDYAGVAAVKTAALRLAYDAFRRNRNPRRRAAFKAFREARGQALAHFAAFEVLRRRFAGPWWEWPAEWQRPDDAAIAKLRKSAPAEIGYHEFIQWIAEEQLSAAQAEARRRKMAVGLYVDIAVGMEPGGAEAWSAQDAIVPQVEVGAPPDLLNTAGQAWGVAAFNPRALEACAFAPFVALLEATMRHAGALRLDHVLGLNRLFLIPFGASPQDGAYVRYPLHALLAAIARTSVHHRCLVIGEDLGTVPAEFRGILAQWGIWSYLVMLFERRDDGSFRLPEDYRRNALVTFSTHDLPTFEGWRTGHDLRVKRGLGLDPGETDAERGRAHWMLGEALAQCGICRDRAWTFGDALRFLARTPSRLLVVQIEDVLGVIDQPNVPGTVREHPNWRRRLPVALEDLPAHAGFQAVADILAQEGRSRSTNP